MEEKLVDVNIHIDFCIVNKENKDILKQEFDSFGEHNQDPINHWLKIAKARGDIEESDNILFNLIIELHKKLDNLENILKNNKQEYIKLDFSTQVIGMGHEYFKLKDFDNDEISFYGRLKMPVFPKRDIPLFFSHISNDIYKIDFMHNRDNIDYDSYITARERALIREIKGYNE